MPIGSSYHSNRFKRFQRGRGQQPDIDDNPFTGDFFDPESNYGNPFGGRGPNAFARSGFGRHLAEQNPEASFLRRVGQSGLPTRLDSNFGGYLGTVYDQLQADFQSARLGNPQLRFGTFMDSIGRADPDDLDLDDLGRRGRRRARNEANREGFADFLRQGFYSESPDVTGVSPGPGAGRWAGWYA